MKIFGRKKCMDIQALIISYYVYLTRDGNENKKGVETLLRKAEYLFGRDFAKAVPILSDDFKKNVLKGV